MPLTVIDKDGNEKPLETVPSYEEKATNAHEGSGLYSAIQDILGDEESGKEKEEKDDKADEKFEKENDEGSGESKDEDGGESGEDGDDENAKGDESEDGGGDRETGDKGDNGSDDLDELDDLDADTLKAKAIELKNTVKAKETDYNKLKTEFESVQAKLNELQKDGVGDPEVKEFLKGLRSDFSGTVEKYRAKYGIPTNDVLLTQLGGGSTAARDARLKQYIQGELKPALEKEFNIEEGKFEFNKDEAWSDPTSASFKFRKAIEKKEAEFDEADEKLKMAEKATVEAIQARQAEDKKWYAEKYLGGDETKVEEYVNLLNAIPAKIASGELKPEDHPLSLRYILRGYFFDELNKIEVDKEIGDLKNQLKDMGVTFPEGKKELPTDISKVKKASKAKNKTIKIEQSKYSPMASSIEDTLNY